MQTRMKTSSTHANSIGQRLKFEMKKRGVTSADLAKKADVKTSFIYDVISGKSANPSTVKLARVADALGVSLTYLVGHGAQADVSALQFPTADYVAIPRLVMDANAGMSSRVQDGEPMLFSRTWLKEHFETDPANLRLLAIRGDSMEPTLCHTDTVLVDTTSKAPAPPGIFIVSDGFGLTPKRLEYASQQKPAKIRVTSDNSKYLSYDRSADDILIIGRVVWFSRAM